jgi:hypothetical protein
MRWSERLVQILTLRCQGASTLASRALDERLRPDERLAMWGHLLACKSCRRFRRQLRFLRQALKERDGGTKQGGDVRDALSPEARARIEQAVAAALRAGDEGDGPMASGEGLQA